MPQINHEIKLDFRDVLLRPKRSGLKSRADVNVHRKFTFLHSKRVVEGVPIIASNMDTVGTFEMANALAKVRLCSVMYID
jgi:GMP reductase